MGAFHTRLILSPLDDGVNWLVWNPFYYQDEVLGLITAPAGMITDGGTIPKMFTLLVQPLGINLRAFVIHDALYKYQWFSREDSDKCLWRMLQDIGDPNIEANLIYDAVRIGGAAYWPLKQEVPNVGLNIIQSPNDSTGAIGPPTTPNV